jgi:hypothetical protein
MKNNQTIIKRNFFLSIGIVMMLFFLNSCAKKVSFQQSTVTPAAEGKVKIKKDKNNNYAIKIDLKNLAGPSRLQQPRSTYVVWMETESNGTKNIGRINSSSGFLSSKLKASFNTVTAFKPVRIFITGEDDADVQYPGTPVVLTTNNF